MWDIWDQTMTYYDRAECSVLHNFIVIQLICDAWSPEFYSQHYQTSIESLRRSQGLVSSMSGCSNLVSPCRFYPGFSVENNPFKTLYGFGFVSWASWWWETRDGFYWQFPSQDQPSPCQLHVIINHHHTVNTTLALKLSRGPCSCSSGKLESCFCSRSF